MYFKILLNMSVLKLWESNEYGQCPMRNSRYLRNHKLMFVLKTYISKKYFLFFNLKNIDYN